MTGVPSRAPRTFARPCYIVRMKTSRLAKMHMQTLLSCVRPSQILVRIAFLALLSVTPLQASTGQRGAQEPGAIHFNQYPTEVYRGHIRIPREFHRDPDGLWVDDSGKPAFQPHVNFAGEYFLAVHSCGTCCRYYTLNNLRTGVEVKEVRMFDAAEPSPVTKDGRTYVPILHFKPGSTLLLVQYELDLCTAEGKNECRQRYFIFEGGHFKAISRTLRFCTHEGEEPE